VSNSIHIQSTASRSRGIAFDIEEIGIYIKEIAADSRETAINRSEIATYIRKSPQTLGKSASTPAAPPPAAGEWPQTAHFQLFPPDLPKTMPISETKAAYFCKGKFPVLDTAKRVLKLRRK
jgi:hypothetical protein